MSPRPTVSVMDSFLSGNGQAHRSHQLIPTNSLHPGVPLHKSDGPPPTTLPPYCHSQLWGQFSPSTSVPGQGHRSSSSINGNLTLNGIHQQSPLTPDSLMTPYPNHTGYFYPPPPTPGSSYPHSNRYSNNHSESSFLNSGCNTTPSYPLHQNHHHQHHPLSPYSTPNPALHANCYLDKHDTSFIKPPSVYLLNSQLVAATATTAATFELQSGNLDQSHYPSRLDTGGGCGSGNKLQEERSGNSLRFLITSHEINLTRL